MVACSHVMYAAAPDPLELDSRPAVTTRDATKMLEELESFLDCDIVADKLRFTKPPAAYGCSESLLRKIRNSYKHAMRYKTQADAAEGKLGIAPLKDSVSIALSRDEAVSSVREAVELILSGATNPIKTLDWLRCYVNEALESQLAANLLSGTYEKARATAAKGKVSERSLPGYGEHNIARWPKP